MNHRKPLACLVILSTVAFQALAQWHFKPEQLPCSLTDTRTDVLSPQTNPIAARAHQVFERLLHAWESEHLPPKLSVIDCGGRVSALSQSTGHILITQQAVKLSLENTAGGRVGPLAFVLAHELIHQLNDFSSPKPPPASPFVESIVGRERERIADAHAVILMALAGFDPHEVTDDRNFFIRWTEAGLGVSCSGSGDNVDTAPCLDAQRRAVEIQHGLYRVAEHTVLFELGLQAFAIGRYDDAIAAFEHFGRIFRSAQVSLNIGLAHFARVRQLDETFASQNATRRVMFPAILASNPGFPLSRSAGSQPLNAEDTARLRARDIEQAIEAFSQVIRMQPTWARGYAYLIFTYMLDGKLGMASGVWKDQYPKDEQNDPLAHLVEALLDVAEKRNDRARERLQLLDKRLRRQQGDAALDRMRYVVCQNLSNLFGHGSSAARALWLDLANWARHEERTLLFQLALLQLRSVDKLAPVSPVRHAAPWRVGDDIAPLLHRREQTTLPLALDETTLTVFSPRAGVHLVADAKLRVRHLWFNRSTKTTVTLDELLAYYGPPDRHIATEAGQYLAYTQRGIGFRITENRLAAVFHFAPPQDTDFDAGHHRQALAEEGMTP